MIKRAAAGYVKAYAMLWLITFSVLFLGFIILGVEYATTLAIVIALLDMLPVIGTGTVLIPWGIVCIAGGGYRRGIGILVLFACVTVIREIAEAKVIGRCIGMHPLLTLAAMYAGYRLLGVAGILLLPLVLNIAKEMTSMGMHKSTKIYDSPIED